MIRVQREDFDVGAELARLTGGDLDIGGLACFVGVVRETAGGERLTAMTLEHYPGMTERQLEKIAQEARARWPLREVLIIHRFGRLTPGERIVMVATASAHRADALESCHFLIDWLKTQAPFWKQESTDSGARWVASRDEDEQAARRWRNDKPG